MHFDDFIIGSGQAGVPLATRLAGKGRKVAIAEKGPIGGSCVNEGCTPTKTLVASARAAHVARTAGRLGIRVPEVDVDFAAVIARKNAIVDQWRSGSEKRIEGVGENLTLLRDLAKFTGPREIEVGGERHTADRVFVNVGCRAGVPSIGGLRSVPFLNNRTLMDLTERPERLLIIGGGYIGCEFAQIYRRLGCDVTVLLKKDRLLMREDPEVSAALAGAFEAEGIKVEKSAGITAVSGREGAIELHQSTGDSFKGTHLLVATGRVPNTDDLGRKEAGIDLDDRGFVKVDDEYRTSAEGVFAVGDCTGGPQFTHSSWDDHRILFDLLENGGTRRRSDRLVPWTVFTDPQVSGVGLTETQAKEREIPYELGEMPFGHVARAVEADETAGVIRIMIDPVTEQILGASIVGWEAGELIHMLVTAMSAGATARAIVDAEMVHPALAEGVQSALMRIPRYALS